MRRDAAAALALLAAGFAATLWLEPFSDERVNDLFVYRSFAAPVLDGALPYRDVPFEYPPLAAAAIALPGLAATGEEAFRWAFTGWTLALGACVLLLCGALAARSGGSRRRALVAFALAPLLCGALIRTHFDLAPVALLLGALLLLCTGRPRAGLAVLGVGALTKGFPLVVAPIALAWLLGRGRRREALEGALALAGVVLAVSAVALAISPSGALDAVQYHLERPVQIESTPAAVLLALDGAGLGAAESVSSHRSDGLVHPADALVAGALATLMAALVALLAATAARPAAGSAEDARRLLLAALAAVLAFATLGKVLSPQFLIWTLPLGALALAWRMHALAAVIALATLLTQVEFPARYLDVVAREPFALGVVALRDATLLVALGLCLRELSVSRPAAAAARSAWRGRRHRPRPAPR